MTTDELLTCPDFSASFQSEPQKITGVYCCDLLSHVMGQSLTGSAWCTVMANINSLAVASLSEASCMVLCHGLVPTQDMIKKATEEKINLFTTSLSEFEAAHKIATLANLLL